LKEIITGILTESIAFMLSVAQTFAALTEDPRIQKREAKINQNGERMERTANLPKKNG